MKPTISLHYTTSDGQQFPTEGEAFVHTLKNIIPARTAIVVHCDEDSQVFFVTASRKVVHTRLPYWNLGLVLAALGYVMIEWSDVPGLPDNTGFISSFELTP